MCSREEFPNNLIYEYEPPVKKPSRIMFIAVWTLLILFSCAVWAGVFALCKGILP